MKFAKLKIDGNDFVGVFVKATDNFILLGNNVSEGKKEIIENTLGVKAFRASVLGSYLIGIYIAANSKGILLPELAYDEEVERLKRVFPNVKIDVLPGDLNALGSNILANDNIAFVNPNFSDKQIAKIADVLGVKVFRATTGGFDTIGANNILTNKGLVLNNLISEKEKEEMEKLSGLKGEQSTANFGSLSIGISSIANSNGTVLGEATTGVEATRIISNLEP